MNNHRDRLANVTNDYIIERLVQNGNRKLSFKILENIDDDQGSFHFLLILRMRPKVPYELGRCWPFNQRNSTLYPGMIPRCIAKNRPGMKKKENCIAICIFS